MDINIPEPRMLKVADVKVDGKNPNKMNAAQLEALKKGITKYGFLVPIITNEDYVVADGEHRLNAAKELQMQEIPAIIMPLKEVDRRTLRQVMNKLRGEHDFMDDSEEIKFLVEQLGKDELMSLLALSEEKIMSYLPVQHFEELPDVDINGDIIDLKDVIIIQLENTQHAEKIRNFLHLQPGRKSIKSGAVIEVIP